MATIQNKGWFRPYSINGLEVKKILFYGNGQIHLAIDQGWLEHSPKNGRRQDVQILEIPNEPAPARKENLGRNDCYYLTVRDPLFPRERLAHLYLPVKPTSLGEVETADYETRKTFASLYRIPLQAVRLEGDPGAAPYITVQTQHRSELTRFGQSVLTLAEQIKDRAGVTIDDYNLRKIMQHFTITPKCK